jgi:hypothetical protein
MMRNFSPLVNTLNLDQLWTSERWDEDFNTLFNGLDIPLLMTYGYCDMNLKTVLLWMTGWLVR